MSFPPSFFMQFHFSKVNLHKKSATMSVFSAKTAVIVSENLPKNTEKSFGTDYENNVDVK